MTLTREAYSKRDLGERRIIRQKHFFGVVNASFN